MNPAPLPPLTSPLDLLNAAGFSVSAHQLASALFGTALVLWALFTLIAIYHWLRYSHNSLVAYPAIITHLVVSGVFILFAGSGLL